MELEAWRIYLDDIIKKRKPAEKDYLYQQIGITRTTVQRWRNGDNIPDPTHIHCLLQALPDEERSRLRTLMQQDEKLHLPNDSLLAGETDRIPQHIYQEVLRISRDAPDRFWLVAGTILFHLLAQLTIPEQAGAEIIIARCMSPRADGKIRSLQAYAARGTAPWRPDFHLMEGFFGAESLAGYVVAQRHGMMIPDIRDSQLTVPLYCQEQEQEQSSAAVPIMREGKVVGALIAICTHVVTDEKLLLLLERYADLLLLAFFDEEFYPISVIELGLMPDLCTQKAYFASFRQRVSEEYKRSVGEGETLQEVGSIEAKVRQDIETELLRLASLADVPHPA